MNAFEKHGIDHLSASSCNLYAAEPALWCAERLLGLRSPVGAAAHRGTAVEAGVTLGLLEPDAPIDKCVDVARQTFGELTTLSSDPKLEDESKAVSAMVRVALPELRSYGRDVVCQEKIEWKADGVSVPFVGYIDFRWPYHGILTDLKTQHKLAGEIKRGHARQVAGYAGQYGSNIDARVTYCTKTKCATYQLENIQQHIDALVRIGKTIERFLAKSDDARELTMLLCPDVDSYYFSDPRTRQMAFDLWGL